jgi:hypothetical protein
MPKKPITLNELAGAALFALVTAFLIYMFLLFLTNIFGL